jgi:hypothetical protein
MFLMWLLKKPNFVSFWTKNTLNQYQIVDFFIFLKFNVGFEQYSSSWYVTLTLNGEYSKTCKNGHGPQVTNMDVTVLLPYELKSRTANHTRLRTQGYSTGETNAQTHLC